MPPAYSSDFVNAVQTAPVRGLGQELALACIDANLPAAYVAQVLGVTRMTLHTWFRGGEIRQKRHWKIDVFMKLVKEDMSRGILPAKTLREARSYLQEMCDEPLRTVTEQANG